MTNIRKLQTLKRSTVHYTENHRDDRTMLIGIIPLIRVDTKVKDRISDGILRHVYWRDYWRPSGLKVYPTPKHYGHYHCDPGPARRASDITVHRYSTLVPWPTITHRPGALWVPMCGKSNQDRAITIDWKWTESDSKYNEWKWQHP